MKIGIIYKVTNILNNKSYIGQSVNLSARKSQHINHAFKKNSQLLFHKALRKYGLTSFIWSIIDQGIQGKDLDNKEKYWITYFQTNASLSKYKFKGYNLAEGGFYPTPRYGNDHHNFIKFTNRQKAFIIDLREYISAEAIRDIVNGYYNLNISVMPIFRIVKKYEKDNNIKFTRKFNISPKSEVNRKQKISDKLKENYTNDFFRDTQKHKFKEGNEHHNSIQLTEEMALFILDRWNVHNESYSKMADKVNEKYNTTFDRKSLGAFVTRRVKKEYPQLEFKPFR